MRFLFGGWAGEEGWFCGISRDCREPWLRGRNAKIEKTEQMGKPALLIPSPERVKRPQMITHHIQGDLSLCQDLCLWHNGAIASPFVPRTACAQQPWCGLIIGFKQGWSKVKTVLLEVLNLAVSETASVLVKSLVWNLSWGILLEISLCLSVSISLFFSLQLSHTIQRNNSYSYSPPLLEEG